MIGEGIVNTTLCSCLGGPFLFGVTGTTQPAQEEV